MLSGCRPVWSRGDDVHLVPRWRGARSSVSQCARPVGTVKTDGTKMTLGAGGAEATVQLRKAQVVAHGQPHGTQGGVRDHDGLPRPAELGLADGRLTLDVDVEQVDFPGTWRRSPCPGR